MTPPLETAKINAVRAAFSASRVSLASSRAARPVATFGMGLALGFYGIGFLLLAAVYGLSTVMAGWLAALLVGTILAIVAIALLISSGKKLKRVNPTPDKTMRSLEENLQWAKHPIK